MPTELDEIVIDAADPESLGTWWAGVLGWHARVDAGGDLVVEPPPAEPGVPLVFCRVPDPGAGTHRLHLDLRSRSEQEQAGLVAQIEAAGGRRIDAGQRDVPWVVLADPEGTRLCVLEPRPEYLAAGAIAAVVAQSLAPAAAARFWASATGWGVTASDPGFASVRAPGSTGPAIEFVAVPRLPDGKNRVHLDVRPGPGSDRDAEVERLRAAGARPLDVGQAAAPPGEVSWVVLADPEGTAFCVLSRRG